jgi:hypothetical protein
MAKQTSMHAPLVGARARHNSEGWAPLIIVRRGNIIIAGGSRTTITCNFEGNQLQLLVSGKKFPFHGVFFAKTFENGKYQISVMQIPEGLRKPHISIFSALLNDGSLVADPELVARPPKVAKTVKKGRPQSILIKIDDPRHPNFRRRISSLPLSPRLPAPATPTSSPTASPFSYGIGSTISSARLVNRL